MKALYTFVSVVMVILGIVMLFITAFGIAVVLTHGPAETFAAINAVGLQGWLSVLELFAVGVAVLVGLLETFKAAKAAM